MYATHYHHMLACMMVKSYYSQQTYTRQSSRKQIYVKIMPFELKIIISKLTRFFVVKISNTRIMSTTSIIEDTPCFIAVNRTRS